MLCVWRSVTTICSGLTVRPLGISGSFVPGRSSQSARPKTSQSGHSFDSHGAVNPEAAGCWRRLLRYRTLLQGQRLLHPIEGGEAEDAYEAGSGFLPRAPPGPPTVSGSAIRAVVPII